MRVREASRTVFDRFTNLTCLRIAAVVLLCMIRIVHLFIATSEQQRNPSHRCSAEQTRRQIVETPFRSTSLVAAVCAATACLLCLLFASTAQAYVDPPVKLGAESANLPDTAGLIVENSPRKISGVESNAATEALYKAETETSPNFDQAVSSELDSEVENLLVKPKVWDWGLAPEITVGLGGGWLGWEIGSAIWATFFKEEEPLEPELHWDNEWYPTRPGQLLLSTVAGNIYAPDWGFVGGRNTGLGVGHITESGECERVIEGDGIRLFTPGWSPELACFETTHPREYRLWRPLGITRCGFAVSCKGVETVPYSGTNQPTAPTAKELQEKLQESLEGEEYPVANRFLNHEKEPENYPDPRVTETEQDHRCDRSPGAIYENPGGNSSPEPFAKKIESPFTVTTRPEGFGGTEVFLRWGTTFWEPGKEGFKETPYLDLWGGWGYRHILAKHGWSALDREETELALSTGSPVPTAKESKFVYSTPEIAKGKGGVECIRKVVVDFGTGEGDPSPRGIITSFNEVK